MFDWLEKKLFAWEKYKRKRNRMVVDGFKKRFFSVIKLYMWYWHIFITNVIQMKGQNTHCILAHQPHPRNLCPHRTHSWGLCSGGLDTETVPDGTCSPVLPQIRRQRFWWILSPSKILYSDLLCTHSKLLNSFGGYSRQSASSDPSPQSLSVSQRQLWGMQRWLEQVNWLAGHVPGTGAGHLDSSLLSKQSLCPSQRHAAGTQRLLAQVNAVGEQVLSAKSKRGTWFGSTECLALERVLLINLLLNPYC